MILIDELDTTATPSRADLAAAVADEAVVAIPYRLLDEELAFLDPDGGPTGAIDQTWLADLPDIERDAAVATAGRLLFTRLGHLRDDEVGPDEPPASTAGLQVLIRDRRDVPATLVAADEQQRRAVVYRVHDELCLVELVGSDGGHEFAYATLAGAGCWLAAALAGDDHLLERLSETPVDADAGTDDLGPATSATDLLTTERETAMHMVHALARHAETPTEVQLSERVDSTLVLRAFTTYACADGLWLYTGYDHPHGGRYAIKRMGTAELARYCARFLLPAQERST